MGRDCSEICDGGLGFDQVGLLICIRNYIEGNRSISHIVLDPTIEYRYDLFRMKLLEIGVIGSRFILAELPVRVRVIQVDNAKIQSSPQLIIFIAAVDVS